MHQYDGVAGFCVVAGGVGVGTQKERGRSYQENHVTEKGINAHELSPVADKIKRTIVLFNWVDFFSWLTIQPLG